MARVTVEDCIVKIPNRFELVMIAVQRSRDLSVGAEMTVEQDNDKNPVVALREIAEGTVNLDDLKNSVIQGLQKHVEFDEPIEESEEQLAVEDTASEVEGPTGSTSAEVGGGDFAGMMGGFEDVSLGEAGNDSAAEPLPNASDQPAVDV